MTDMDTKDAFFKYSLKARSGYRASGNARISANQYGQICAIIEGQQPDTIQVDRAEYEQLKRDADRWDTVYSLMVIGDVNIRQDEDGGYSLSVEPVENILAQRWSADQPDELIDAIRAASLDAAIKQEGGE